MSSLAPVRVLRVDSVGASLTAVTSSVSCTGVADSRPALSLATTVKALSAEPNTFAPGVQNARCVASTVLLVSASQAVAEVASAPMRRLPELTALTTMAVTVPSTSASLPAASRSARLRVCSASSLTLAAGEVNAVRVGASFVGVMLTVVDPVAVQRTARAAGCSGIAVAERPVNLHTGRWGIRAVAVTNGGQGLVDPGLRGIAVEADRQGARRVGESTPPRHQTAAHRCR